MAATRRAHQGPPECGHPDRAHFAKGMCQQCYMRDYDEKRSGRPERRKDPSEYAPGYRNPPRKPARVPDCHPDRPHAALGLCQPCYTKDLAERARATCHPDRPLVADGLCNSCYKARKYWDNPEEARRKANEAHRALGRHNRAEMVEAYGGQCSCPRCPETNPAFLTLEHVNGDGAEHRRAVGRGHAIADLRRRGWPKEGYTLLCWNCNCATKGGNTCPHMEE